MWSLLARPFGYILQFLYGLIGNYAVCIIIFSVLIRFAMYPLLRNQIKSTAGMAEFSAKSKEIQTKYAGDKELMNQKLAELQRESGYNPTAGCLPALVQMFVISGLFVLLRYPLTYYQDEAMVFAVHESFLWIKDLSQPDPWILPILAGIATYVAQSVTSITGSGADQTNRSMAILKYVFPVMILWLARTYPAGIAIYWFISQFTQIFFNIRLGSLRKKIQAQEERAKEKARREAKRNKK